MLLMPIISKRLFRITYNSSVVIRPSVSTYQYSTEKAMANIETPVPSTLKVETHSQYHSLPFGPASVHPDPLVQFRAWFANAQSPLHPEQGKASASNPTFVPQPKVQEPEAMTLSTVGSSGIPSARTVLLKEVDSEGFIFYTNYTSRKSQELLENPHAALCFYWKELHQQVRVVGQVEKLNDEASDQYYNSRPINSRLGAWASPQSQVIGEGDLAKRVSEVEERFGFKKGVDVPIPRPEFWGGWRVIPM
jgi:pyridoxamine-phosphate oxidase